MRYPGTIILAHTFNQSLCLASVILQLLLSLLATVVTNKARLLLLLLLLSLRDPQSSFSGPDLPAKTV